jgi:hypothetical protein
VHTYPVTKESRGKLLSIMQDLHNNEYNKDLSMRNLSQLKHNKNRSATPGNEMGYPYI